MIIGIQQAEHLPWIGFFNKMATVDGFVLLDHVQFKKNYFENRNRIKTANGVVWLTVPVRQNGRFGQSLMEVEISDDPKWKKKYLKTVEQEYKKSPFWEDVRNLIWPVFEQASNLLIDLNLGLIDSLAAYLKISTPRIRSSSMDVGGEHKGGLVLKICQSLSAATYLSGPDGRNYLDFASFEKNGIQVAYHDFGHPVYPQMHGDFVSHLSILDLIANCGQESQRIVRECYKFTPPIVSEMVK